MRCGCDAAAFTVRPDAVLVGLPGGAAPGFGRHPLALGEDKSSEARDRGGRKGTSGTRVAAARTAAARPVARAAWVGRAVARPGGAGAVRSGTGRNRPQIPG